MVSEDAYETSPHGGSCGRIVPRTLCCTDSIVEAGADVMVCTSSCSGEEGVQSHCSSRGSCFGQRSPLHSGVSEDAAASVQTPSQIVLNPKRRKVSLTALQYSNQSGVWLWPLHANSSYTGQCRSPNGKNRPSATAYNTRQVSPLTETVCGVHFGAGI